MSFGVSQAVLSILTLIVMMVWAFKGPGVRKTRIILTSAYVLLQGYSWVMILVFGAFHTIGEWAIGLCFVTSILAFIVIATYKRMYQNQNL